MLQTYIIKLFTEIGMTDFKHIFESRYTWIEGFMRNVRRYSWRTAMIDPVRKQTWTYQQLNADVNKLVNRLNTDGLKKGDLMMLMMLNCPEFVFVYIAAHKGHFVNSPVSYRLSTGELADLLKTNRPKVFFFDLASKPVVLQAVKMSGWTPQQLVVTDGNSDGVVKSYVDYVDGSSDDEPVFTCEYNIYDETTRLFTSGTPVSNAVFADTEVPVGFIFALIHLLAATTFS